MFESFLLIALPYLAIASLVVGTIWRFRSKKYGVSALSSQFLESRQLLWGSVPWHIGIVIVLVGHIVPLAFPGVWQRLVASETFLITVETIGLAAAILSLVGLVLLIVRRVLGRRLQSVTSVMDLVILVLLLGQIVLGILTALNLKWGAAWAPGTLSPYLWSLLTLQPDPSYVSQMPIIMTLHITGGWLILLLTPFSRLIHMFTIPLEYLTRAPQKVVWATQRRMNPTVEAFRAGVARRHFIKGAVGITAAGGLLAVGALGKVFGFLKGPRLEPEEAAELGETKLKKLRQTAEEKELELQRLEEPLIRVAQLGDLQAGEGKYFIDYNMRPALAFARKDGLPQLISAKCTHLGCTVGSQADESGRILCPCHVSWFSIDSGSPNDGAPAKEPLPILGWVVLDTDGKEIARRSPGLDGRVEGSLNGADPSALTVYIAKEYREAELT